MKQLIVVLCLLLSFTAVTAQPETVLEKKETIVTDTLPAYVRIPYLPTFSIQQPDSSWFSKSQLADKKPVLLLYFSPDCGHCMLETEDMISKMNNLKNLQIVMVTSRPFEDMKNFADHYKLARFKNVKIGRDPSRTVTRYYNVKTTPFSAVYDKKGKLIKAYEKGIDWKELIDLIN